MNVLFINDYCDERGGAQVIDRRISESLADRGHEVEFFCAEGDSMVSEFVKSHYSLADAKELKRTLADFSPDICFSSCLGYRLSPWLLRHVEDAGVPICLKVPDYSIYGYPTVTRSRPQRILAVPRTVSHRVAVGKFVDRLVVQSNNSREYATGALSISPQRTRVIRNPTLFDPVETPSPNADGRVLYVGRIERDKGIEQLVRAVARTDDLRLELIGGGEFESEAKRLCRDLCDEAQFEFKGYIDHSRLPKHYRRASVFALPSTIPESFGLTILEAMSQGTPAVTTNIGAQQELVTDGETGFTVSPDDVAALADSLRQIGTNSQMNERMSHNALDYARQFTMDKYVTRIENLFEELVGSHDTKQSV